MSERHFWENVKVFWWCVTWDKLLYGIDITRKAEFQFVMFCWLCKTRIGGDSFHRQPGIYWIFTQTKLSSIYRRKLLCLDEILHVACNLGENPNFQPHIKLRLKVVSTVRQQSEERSKLECVYAITHCRCFSSVWSATITKIVSFLSKPFYNINK